MQRALILTNGPVIEREHIHLEPLYSPCEPASAAPSGERTSARADKTSTSSREQRASGKLASSLSAAEHEIILAALRADNGNRQAVAKRLGISPRTLRYKLARMREAGVEI